MKFTTFIAILFFSLKLHSQKELLFDIHYKPDTDYYQTIIISSESNTKYSADDEILDKLKSKGIQNPTLSNSVITNELIFKTGKMDSKFTFPIIIEYIKSVKDDGKKLVPDRTKIYGIGSLGNMPKIDSIVSEGMDEKFKATLSDVLKSTFSQISFPKKNIKIGESFSQEVPLKIPISGNNIEFKLNIVYTLKSIHNGLARFDILQNYIVDAAILNQNIVIDGNGNGEILYDIKSDFFLNYKTKSFLSINLLMNGITIDVKTVSIYDQKVTIKSK